MPEAAPVAPPVAAPAAKPAVVAPAAKVEPGKTVVAAPVTPAKTDAPVLTEEEKKDKERRAANVAHAKRLEAENRKLAEQIKADKKALKEERDRDAAERQSWKAQQAEILKKASERDAFSSHLQNKEVLKALELAGIPRESVLEAIVKGDTRTPEEIAQAVVDKSLAAQKKLDEDARVEYEKKRAEAQANANAEMKSNSLRDMKKLIGEHPERFESCARHANSVDLAWQNMVETYNRTAKKGNPELLTFEQALDEVEEQLYASDKSWIASSKKLAAEKAAAEAEEKKKADEEAAAVAKAGTKRRFFTEAEPRKVVQPAATPQLGNLHTVKSRRELGRQFESALQKARE